MEWLRQLFTRRRRLDDRSVSIQEHLDEKIVERMDDVMWNEEATQAARRTSGIVTVFKEQSREGWQWELFESLWADCKFAVRQLGRSPGFSLTIILTLALGIGANTAIFSLVNAFLLRPLPYPHADRLVMVWEQLTALGINRFPSPIGDYNDYKNDNRVFAEMAGVEDAHYVLTAGDYPQRLFAVRVTSNLFHLAGLHPTLGRTFSDIDNQPGHEHVVVLSDALWRNRFGASPSILGKNVILDGQNYEVVGVLQRNVRFSVGYPQTPDVWVPLPMVADPDRRVGHLNIVARLRDGVTLGQARADMSTVAAQLERQYHIEIGPNGEDPGYRVEVIPLREELAGDLRQPLLLMLGAAALIFLIACANVANLMLTQGVNREREFAIRFALGVRRTQLVRLLLVQSVLLAVLGEVAGVAVGAISLTALVRISPYGMAKLFHPSIDMRVITFATCGTFAALLLFSLLPCLRILRPKRSVQLTGNTNQLLGGKRGNRVSQTLVVVETAFSVALVIGAGLLIQSFLALKHVSLGFNPGGLLTAQISLPPGYSTGTQQSSFYEALIRRIQSTPGVAAVAATTLLPVADSTLHNPFSVQGRPWQPYGADRIPQFLSRQAVSVSYFRDLQVPLKQGRVFDDRDRASSQPVVIVNETMVRGFWPREDPIGKRMMQGAPRPGVPWLTVIGVVGDVRSGGPNADYVPEIYTPLAQTPSPSMALVLRAERGDPAKLINNVRDAVATLDRGIPLTNVATYDEILAQQIGPRRYEMLLLVSFGGLALLLAAVGLYGVTSYAVTQRSQEIALRIALGATRSTVVALVLRQALLLTGCGLFVGVLMALSLRQVLAATLFHVGYLDVPVYLTVSITLLLVALAAAFFPSRRAAYTDPMQALRAE